MIKIALPIIPYKPKNVEDGPGPILAETPWAEATPEEFDDYLENVEFEIQFADLSGAKFESSWQYLSQYCFRT